MQLDLPCHDYRGKSYPFRVALLEHALDHLIEDARQAYRVYELFAVRRPGDVWKYLWVQLIEVSERVQQRYQHARTKCQKYQADHPWPAHQIPLMVFDDLFWWCGDDTEPEDECWLRARKSATLQASTRRWFDRIRAAQTALEASDDVLIRHEIRALQAMTHPYDTDAHLPLVRTPPFYVSPTRPQRTPAYYHQLQTLLTRPAVRCVACRGDQDFHTLRLVGTEQRRRAETTGQLPVASLAISVLSDGVPAMTAWQAVVVFYSEGLGYGDLYVDQPDRGASLKDLVEKHHRRSHWFLTWQDAGEIDGYQRTCGAGWVCYEDQDPDRDYEQISRAQQAQYIARYEHFMQRQNAPLPGGS